MKNHSRSPRFLAIAGLLALSAPFVLSSTPVQAKDGRNAKIAATALGALGAYWLVKGKTTEGAVALGAGYLAYRKGSKDQKEASQRTNRRDVGYSSRPSRPVYPSYRLR